MKSILIFGLIFLVSENAYCGSEVYGVNKDLGAALQKTISDVEKAAVLAGTCVSSYPNPKKCELIHGDYWMCVAVRADHKGSCATKTSDLDNFIKGVNGLSQAAQKSAVAASAF
jgi:hypothetical protein